MPNTEADMLVPETHLAPKRPDEPLLLQIRSDRRLGHEWDDWDGEALPDGGVFRTNEVLFFQLVAGLVSVSAAGAWLVAWLVGPRVEELGISVGSIGTWFAALGLLIALAWMAAVWAALRTGRNRLPSLLAERGVIPWLMPWVEKFARLIGVSRDRSGNASLRVYNGLMAGRSTVGVLPGELLILLPRCLGKEAMQTAMSVAERYGVPMFVAARGRYARQMIAMRRPKGVVAVACERDLVSGVHDVASKLPVLGTTLSLPDGPCRNTEFEAGELEGQIRTMLGLSPLGATDA